MMGVGPGYRSANPYTHSSHSYNALQSEINNLKDQIAKNPDPSNFEILECEQVSDYMVLKVKYPNCTNAEGIKIMVVKGTPLDLLRRKTLDPHFGHPRSPIARFEPTDSGWRHALAFTTTLKA